MVVRVLSFSFHVVKSVWLTYLIPEVPVLFFLSRFLVERSRGLSESYRRHIVFSDSGSSGRWSDGRERRGLGVGVEKM